MNADRYTKTMLTIIAVALSLLALHFALGPLLQPGDAVAGRLVAATQGQFATSGTLGGGMFYTTAPGEPWDISLYEAKGGRIYLLGTFNYGWRPADPSFNREKSRLEN